jgi:small redox-active disulfide protein 2
MRDIKILGPGCAKCLALHEAVKTQAQKIGLEVKIEKITEFEEIAAFGVMSMPALAIDGKIVHAGSVPDDKKIAELLEAKQAGAKESTGHSCCSCCCDEDHHS